MGKQTEWDSLRPVIVKAKGTSTRVYGSVEQVKTEQVKENTLITHPCISRRRFLSTSLAAAGALRLAPRSFALASARCLLTPEQEVGPFYVGGDAMRSSLAEGKPGVPLRLRLVLWNQATCAPLENAAIDLWHCDAMGLYSGYTAGGGFPGGGGPEGGRGPEGDRQGPPPGPPPGSPSGFDPAHGLGFGPDQGMRAPTPTDKLTFLRGIQMSNADGSVTYDTIFPGFYEGRVNHIHFKVRLEGHRSGQTYAAGHTSHNGQVFFPEELATHLMEQPPYVTHAIHRTTIAEDHVFNDQQGAFATVRARDTANRSAGFVAEYHAVVNPTAVPAAVRMGPG